jgi:hypothetical protein
MNIKTPSSISKENESIVKDPLILEHNLMGVKFRNNEITKVQWEEFKEDWHKRFKLAMNAVIESRVYVEDTVNGK